MNTEKMYNKNKSDAVTVEEKELKIRISMLRNLQTYRFLINLSKVLSNKLFYRYWIKRHEYAR